MNLATIFSKFIADQAQFNSKRIKMKNIAQENLAKLGKGLGESKLGKGLGDFKKFISRGNVVDMAVGVIIGTAFGKIVSSLVNDVLMPFIGIFLGGVDFSALSITIGEAQIKYGTFIQTIIDFTIIAFTIFVVVKLFERLKRKEEQAPAAPAVKSEDIVLLSEIRDLLKEKK